MVAIVVGFTLVRVFFPYSEYTTAEPHPWLKGFEKSTAIALVVGLWALITLVLSAIAVGGHLVFIGGGPRGGIQFHERGVRFGSKGEPFQSIVGIRLGARTPFTHLNKLSIAGKLLEENDKERSLTLLLEDGKPWKWKSVTERVDVTMDELLSEFRKHMGQVPIDID